MGDIEAMRISGMPSIVVTGAAYGLEVVWRSGGDCR
jgi:hypothetical protein